MATATTKAKPKPDTSFTDDVIDDEGNSVAAAHDDVVDDQGRVLSAPAAAPRGHAVGAGGGWDEEEPRSVGGFLKNIPGSAIDMGKSLVEMARHPANTAAGVGHVLMGGIESARHPFLSPLQADPNAGAEDIPIFDAFLYAMKARYGGWTELGNTLYNDPVGAALDLSGLLTGGSSAIEARLPSVARYLRIAGETIDPLRATMRTVSGVRKLAGSGSAEVLGKSTGVGAEAIRVAANAAEHPQFVPAMRGGVEHVEVLDQVRGALFDLADRRRSNYQAQLAQLPKQLILDMQPVHDAMHTALKDFNISIVNGPKGPTLDFSRSSLRHIGAETSKVQAMFDDLMQWGSRADDTTPLSLDRLKQGLNEMVSVAPGRGDVVVKRVADATRDVLVKSVPGYQQMTSDYAKASKFLDEVNAELSVKPGANAGTGIRKIATALNQRSDYRRMLIDVIDAQTGTDIKGAIAGLEMRSAMPRGIIGPLALGAGGVELLPKLSGFVHDPAALASALVGATAFSPRIVGEVLAAISNARSTRLATAMGSVAKGATRIAFDPKTYRFIATSNAANKEARADDAGGLAPPPDVFDKPVPTGQDRMSIIDATTEHLKQMSKMSGASGASLAPPPRVLDDRPAGTSAARPYEGQAQVKSLEEYEFDQRPEVQAKIQKLRELEARYSRLLDDTTPEMDSTGHVTEAWKRKFNQLGPQMSSFESRINQMYGEITKIKPQHENGGTFNSSPIYQMIPPRFANARKATGSSDIEGTLGSPGRHGLYGEYMGGVVPEPDTDLPTAPVPASVVNKPPKEGEIFNNILTDKSGSHNPFVILHEYGHAAYLKDLTNGERTRFKQIYDKYVGTDDPDKQPEAIIKYGPAGKPEEAFASLFAAALLNPRGFKARYPDLAEYFSGLARGSKRKGGW